MASFTVVILTIVVILRHNPSPQGACHLVEKGRLIQVKKKDHFQDNVTQRPNGCSGQRLWGSGKAPGVVSPVDGQLGSSIE